MTRQLTKRQATKAYNAVKRVLKPWGAEVNLYEPGYHCSGWTIACEGGPYDWPYLLTGGGIDEEFGFKFEPVTFDPEVYAEPLNNWAIGLYWDR